MKLVPLGSLVKIKTGKLDANASSFNGVYPFFTCSVKPLRIDSYSYDCECVLVAGNGDLNVKYYNGKFDAYQRTYIIESLDKNVLNIKYLYFFMEKYIEVLRNQAIGGVIKYIKLGDLTNAEIPMVGIESQKKIVEVLEKSKVLISKRQAQITALDELTQSVFLEMFGNIQTNSLNWPIWLIGTLLESIEAGWSVSGEEREKMLDELVVLKISAVTKGIFNPNEYKVIKKDIEIKKAIYPQKGDVLFSRANTREMVGASVFVDDDYPNLILPDKLWKIRLDEEQVVPEYFQAIISHPVSRSEFSKNSTGTSGSMLNISMKKFRDISVPIPPMSLQKEYRDFLVKIKLERKQLEMSLQELENLYNSLLKKAFKGNVFKG